MEKRINVTVLLIEDNEAFANLVKLYLARAEEAAFDVIWRGNGKDGIDVAAANPAIDVILMDYFLPLLNGLETTKQLRQKNIEIPIIFLTVNKDVDLAVEVMKAGVEDYLVKEEVTTPILPKTIMGVVEKRRFNQEMAELDIRKKRLEAIHELVVGITAEIGVPLEKMQEMVTGMTDDVGDEKVHRYLEIIKENVDRIRGKMNK
ncbi:MAG: response regulator, partial [Proteobacteria bacterium]|nr:response regulator [Pseudomonadota bacterium]